MNHRILNLGAGTQSSVLLLMCDRGEVEPVEVAIFADTQAEPREVYAHLDWLEKQVKTRVIRLTAGNLEADAVEFRQHRMNENSSTGRKGHAADQAGQEAKKLSVGTPFIHREMKPLDEVDLREDDEKNGQYRLFGMSNECEGMCGV